MFLLVPIEIKRKIKKIPLLALYYCCDGVQLYACTFTMENKIQNAQQQQQRRKRKITNDQRSFVASTPSLSYTKTFKCIFYLSQRVTTINRITISHVQSNSFVFNVQVYHLLELYSYTVSSSCRRKKQKKKTAKKKTFWQFLRCYSCQFIWVVSVVKTCFVDKSLLDGCYCLCRRIPFDSQSRAYTPNDSTIFLRQFANFHLCCMEIATLLTDLCY